MAAAPPPAPVLTGAQKRFLRGLAQRLEASVWVGEAGPAPGVLRALDEALGSRELVKVRMRAPADKRSLAAELARASGAVLVALVGHTAVLYRPDPEDPTIELPRRETA
jgi:RNA-binding protein